MANPARPSKPVEVMTYQGNYPPFAIYRGDWMESFPPHQHDFLELTYIPEGKGRGRNEDREFTFSARDLLITRPGVEHAFLAEKGKRHKQVSMALYPQLLTQWGSPQGLASYRQLLESDATHMSLAPDGARDVERTIENLFREFIFRQPGFERLLALELERLLVLYHRNLDAQPGGVGRMEDLPPALREALEEIESSFYHIEGLDDLISDSRVSTKQVIALFKRHLGLTPIQYLIRVRIEKCCGMLGDEDLAITDAAHHCGFNDLGHFNTQFKALTSLTPREFRKRLVLGTVKPHEFSRFHFPGGKNRAE